MMKIPSPAALRLGALILGVLLPASAGLAQPVRTIDLAATDPANGKLMRVLGALGNGQYGVPVAGGHDVDGDGHAEVAVAYMTADPLGRANAGQIDLVFGDGTIRGTIDTVLIQQRVLRIFGVQPSETAGSEIWMDDVTGDGLGDLLICRQNYSPTVERRGAGALTIIAGGAGLATLASSLEPLDLAAPDPAVTVTHIIGRSRGDRFCIWARTGDVDGDGLADLAVGADQESRPEELHHGAVYLLRGGAHLTTGGTYELDGPELAGERVRIVPPPGSSEHHFGGTCQIADLDGDGRGEVLGASTINRAGAALSPTGGPAGHAVGGAGRGRVHILWDENFDENIAGAWPDELVLTAVPNGLTILRGGLDNLHFGEEIVGGGDVDGDGVPDLFIGDLTGDGTPDPGRLRSGIGYMIYDAAALRGEDVTIDQPPAGLVISTILGPNPLAIGGDTAALGDVDGDGLADLAYCSPKAAPAGRLDAGALHLFFGRPGGWPAEIDVANLPPASEAQVLEVQGARGRNGADSGDILCYSAALGDIDGDGKPDLIFNEMEGNGSKVNDVGNLVVLRSARLRSFFYDDFETADLTAWSKIFPVLTAIRALSARLQYPDGL